MYLQQAGSDSSRANQILGAEAAIWSEMNHADALSIRVWPRGAALAERLWTDPQGEFSTRASRSTSVKAPAAAVVVVVVVVVVMYSFRMLSILFVPVFVLDAL